MRGAVAEERVGQVEQSTLGFVSDPDFGYDIFASHPDLVTLNSQFESQISFAPKRWVSANDVPTLAYERALAQQEAESILETRMQHLREGEYDQVPQAVDPLTTAARVIEAARRFGEDSKQHRMWLSSLLVDSHRLLTEAWSKGRPEYFPALEQPYDPQARGYSFMGRVLLDMVADGITPVAEPDEQLHRAGEYVEEKTYPAIRKLGRMATSGAVELSNGALVETTSFAKASVSTISECADWAIEAAERGDESNLGGYVVPIRKLMIRTIRYDHDRDVRYQEQVALPGRYITDEGVIIETITHEVIVETMRRLGVMSVEDEPDKVAIRQMQLIDLEGQGALSLARELDVVASEFSGHNIFMGEVVPETHRKDYAAIPTEAAVRQEKLESDSEKLADYLIQLEQKGTDHHLANYLVEKYVKDLLLQKVILEPEEAAVVFDEQTATSIRQYHNLQRNGDGAAAKVMLLRIEREAPPAAFCTAGSCGLVGVDLNSAEGQKVRDMGLNVGAEGTILRDTERVCPGCSKRGNIYYDSQSSSKLCTGCGNKEIK